jgi:enoyl-CoA hydratase/carnithine racemase
MSTMNLTLKDNIHILTLTNAANGSDNTFTTEVMNEYIAAFDTIEDYQGNSALIITCEDEKTFSTGINLAWLSQQSAQGQADFMQAFHTMLCRFALLNIPTIVAINGNAYAGGAILAAGADFRLMREDRGRFCFPEVNIPLPFTPVTRSIVSLLPNKQALKNMLLTGIAYTGVEAEALNVVDSIHPADQLQMSAFKLAEILATKDRAIYSSIRNDMRPQIQQLLNELTGCA